MEYFKVKPKHVFHDGFNKVTLWAWIRLMALVAEIETMPTERQMLAIITKRELELLSSHFKSEGKDTSSVLRKVLEDVEELKIGREKWKEKKRQLREKLKNVHLDISGDSQAKVKLNNITTNNNNIPKENKGAFAPPSLKEVSDYCLERFNKVDAQMFIDFYQSKNWMIGKNKMRDWKASVRTWEKRNDQNNSKGGINNGKQFKSKLDSTLDATREFIEEIDSGVFGSNSGAEEPDFAERTPVSLEPANNQGSQNWQNL